MDTIDKNIIIDFDFQGWPVKKLTIREILLRLGFTEKKYKSGKVGYIAPDKDILDQYPITLEDDGMGYGVNDMFICGATYNGKEDKYPVIIEVDKENKERVDEILNVQHKNSR